MSVKSNRVIYTKLMNGGIQVQHITCGAFIKGIPTDQLPENYTFKPGITKIFAITHYTLTAKTRQFPASESFKASHPNYVHLDKNPKYDSSNPDDFKVEDEIMGLMIDDIIARGDTAICFTGPKELQASRQDFIFRLSRRGFDRNPDKQCTYGLIYTGPEDGKEAK